MSLFELRRLVIALHLRLDALEYLSGVLEKPSHVGPDHLFEPLGVHEGCVMPRRSVGARGAVVITFVVRVQLAPRRVGSSDTSAATLRALYEPSQEVLAVPASPGVVPVLLETR